MSYFQNSSANITNNTNLREPQIEAYNEVYDHFNLRESNEEALVVLPTGTGKTGLMAIAPYQIADGRVLIITPQTVIRDSVLGSLDPLYPKNFWLLTRVFDDYSELPTVIEYDKSLLEDILNRADIVILNVHKLQERLDSSLLRRVGSEFFDMIIIDEAHHSEANTWKRAIEYFNHAKVVKVTGTPFRSDGKRIQGKEVYSYSLGRAMANGYVKSLEKIDYIPDQMYFTLDHVEDRLYSLEEIRELGLKEEDWINRSVALSDESNRRLIDVSLEYLDQKKEITSNPHKIIAVACSIPHADKIKHLYEEKGYKCSIVHSGLEKQEREKEFLKIENHEVDIVINVAMLGEGFDHKFLTIATIFRPFKTLLPYAQFVGRVLRSITPEDGNVIEEDNIATVIHHKELGLEELWDFYKKERKKRDIIKKIREDVNLDPDEYSPRDISHGEAKESDDFVTETDPFIETQLLQERKEN